MTRKHTPLLLIFLALPLLSVSSVRAETITFDDLEPFYSQNVPIYDYAGLTWKNFYSMNVPAQYASGYSTGYLAGMVSAPFVAYNLNGDVAEFSANAPFTFVSASLASAWLDSLEVTVEGYLDSELVATSTVKVSPTAAQLFTFNYKGVNKVVFTPSGGTPLKGYSGSGTFFVMDNLEVTQDDVESTSLDIDVRTGDGTDVINPKSNGVIRVAILSSESFDATTVDPLTALFGPTGTEAQELKVALKDVNGDGRVDMVLYFATNQTGIQCSHRTAKLKAKSVRTKAKDQQDLEGTASIRTVPCK